MKTFKILFLIFVSISWTSYSQQTNQIVAALNIENSISTDEFKAIDEPYNIAIDIETTENNNSYLVISMELNNDSYYVSPNAKRDFKGKFYMDLGSYTNVDFEGKIIETPLSVEEIDLHPFVNGTVNWVRENTTYKQALNLKSKDDFEVYGRIRFTIEPRCTLEEITFGIVRQEGKMKITYPKC